MAIKTYVAREADIERRWFIVDAQGQTLGRLASEIATILRGKHKPIFSPHQDVGDYVVVVNAEKVRVTGAKTEQKNYYRHSGYPGGFRQTKFRDMIQQHPERVIEKAVRGMIPHNVLGEQTLRKLRVYAGPDHPHVAQQPTPLEIKTGHE